MTRIHRSVWAAVAIAGAATIGCAVRGDDAGGLYVLRAMGDSLPPFVEYNSGGYVTTLLADTLAIDGRGTAIETGVVRVQGPTGQPMTTTDVRQGSYTLGRDTLYINWVCNAAERAAAAPRLSATPAPGKAASPADTPRRYGFDVCVWPVYVRTGSGLTMVPRLPQQSIAERFYQRVEPFPLVP